MEKGYFIENHKETGGLIDVVKLFRRYFDVGTDLVLFLLTLLALFISNYLTSYSDVIAGQTLANIVTGSLVHWSRASLVMLAPAVVCHKEPARASKTLTRNFQPFAVCFWHKDAYISSFMA